VDGRAEAEAEAINTKIQLSENTKVRFRNVTAVYLLVVFRERGFEASSQNKVFG
jgi:hypothetical protein